MKITIENVVVREHVVREFKERIKKPDHECTDLTLATRRYAYLKHNLYVRKNETIRQRARDKYHNDPVYRRNKLDQIKESRRLKKLQLAQTPVIETCPAVI